MRPQENNNGWAMQWCFFLWLLFKHSNGSRGIYVCSVFQCQKMCQTLPLSHPMSKLTDLIIPHKMIMLHVNNWKSSLSIVIILCSYIDSNFIKLFKEMWHWAMKWDYLSKWILPPKYGHLYIWNMKLRVVHHLGIMLSWHCGTIPYMNSNCCKWRGLLKLVSLNKVQPVLMEH